MDSMRQRLAAAATFLTVLLVLRVGDSFPSSNVDFAISRTFLEAETFAGDFAAVLTPEQGADLHAVLGPRSRELFSKLTNIQTSATPSKVDAAATSEDPEDSVRRVLVASTSSLEKAARLTGLGGRPLPGSTSGLKHQTLLAGRTQRGTVKTWGHKVSSTTGTLATRAASAWNKWRSSNSLWGRKGKPTTMASTSSTTTLTTTTTTASSLTGTSTSGDGGLSFGSGFNLDVEKWTQGIGTQSLGTFAGSTFDPNMPFTAKADDRTAINTMLGIGGSPGMLGEANGDYGVTQWSNTASSFRAPGPCTAFASSVVINVFTPEDFQLRRKYPNTKTVTLVLQNDINLAVNQTLTFNGSFSCTILTSAKTAPNENGYYINYPSDNFAALFINGANNIISLNVSYWHGITPTSPLCKGTAMSAEYTVTSTVCPAVFVQKSYGIQIGKGNVFGRVEVYRSLNVRLDFLNITTNYYDFPTGYGCIKIAFCGIPMNMTIGNVLITNNEVYGVDSAILVFNGASGVGIYNNYVHDWGFSGIRIGDKISEVFTTAYVDVSQNLVVGKPVNLSVSGDTAGLYWNTHWFGPGHVVRCNYVHYGDHCMYLDNWSSDMKLKGGACINNRDGVKINNGRKNIVEDIVMKNTSRDHAFVSCLFWNGTNCIRRNGIYYNNMRMKYYNSDFFQKAYPWWDTICSNTTANNGQSCNPPGSLDAVTTANCSGMPVENVVDLVTVSMVKTGAPLFSYAYCASNNLTALPKLNNFSSVAIANATAAKFLNYAGNDLGLQPDSPIYATRPNFLSCPRKYVGPQKFSYNSYFYNFNIAKPDMYDKITTMITTSIMETALAPNLPY